MMTGYATSVLRTCIEKYFPDLTSTPGFSRIPTGRFNTSYVVDTSDGKLVLRIAPPTDSAFVFYERDMMRQEPSIHELLLQRTSLPVPRIRAFDSSHEILHSDYIIMDYIPGTPLGTDRRQRQTALFELGEKMAEVHRVTSERYGYLGEHQPMLPQTSWVDAFSTMWQLMVEGVASVGYYSPEEASSLIQLFRSYRGLFDRPVASSLLHMDLWNENILTDSSGHITGILDWDRALWGDPEIEFAVLDYCGLSEPPFWEGYGQARDTSREARMRSVFYLLYEIQKYIIIRGCRDRNPASAHMSKNQVLDIVARVFS